MIKPEDDYFHAKTDDPYWNESSANYFFVPERKMQGWIYFWHRPNMNCSSAQISIWDDTAHEKNDIPFWEYWEFNRLGADMFDFDLDFGLRSQLKEPLRAFELSFRGDQGLEFDLNYSALTEPYEYLNEAAEEGSMNEDMSGFGAKGHYSQGCHVEGEVRLEGENFAIDCYAFHDHSWGPRTPPGSYKRGGLSNLYTPETSFDVWTASFHDPDTDPMHGTTETIITGMYSKDGVLSPVVGGTQRTTERGPDGEQLKTIIDLEDKLGRTFHAEGECLNWYRWNGFCRAATIESTVMWRYDGQEAIGYYEDFRSLRQNRRIRRQIRGA